MFEAKQEQSIWPLPLFSQTKPTQSHAAMQPRIGYLQHGSCPIVDLELHIWYQSQPNGFKAFAAKNMSWRITCVMIQSVIYPITKSVLHRLSDPYGAGETIDFFPVKSRIIVFIKYGLDHDAAWGFRSLQGRNTYNSCCQLDTELIPLLSGATLTEPSSQWWHNMMKWCRRPMSKKQQGLQRHKQQQISRHKQTHLSTKTVARSTSETGAAKLTAAEKLGAAAVVGITAATATALANLKSTVLAKATRGKTSLGRQVSN